MVTKKSRGSQERNEASQKKSLLKPLSLADKLEAMIHIIGLTYGRNHKSAVTSFHLTLLWVSQSVSRDDSTSTRTGRSMTEFEGRNRD